MKQKIQRFIVEQNRIEKNHIFTAKTHLHELNNLQYCLLKEKDL